MTEFLSETPNEQSLQVATDNVARYFADRVNNITDEEMAKARKLVDRAYAKFLKGDTSNTRIATGLYLVFTGLSFRVLEANYDYAPAGYWGSWKSGLFGRVMGDSLKNLRYDVIQRDQKILAQRRQQLEETNQ